MLHTDCASRSFVATIEEVFCRSASCSSWNCATNLPNTSQCGRWPVECCDEIIPACGFIRNTIHPAPWSELALGVENLVCSVHYRKRHLKQLRLFNIIAHRNRKCIVSICTKEDFAKPQNVNFDFLSMVFWINNFRNIIYLSRLYNIMKLTNGTASLHNVRPAGHMRPARAFWIAENVAIARLRIINCPFRIFSTQQRNRLLRPAAKLHSSIWPFKLSELRRPAVQRDIERNTYGWYIR